MPRQLAINYALKSSTFNLILIVFSSVVIAAGQHVPLALLHASHPMPPWGMPHAAGTPARNYLCATCRQSLLLQSQRSYFKDIMQ